MIIIRNYKHILYDEPLIPGHYLYPYFTWKNILHFMLHAILSHKVCNVMAPSCKLGFYVLGEMCVCQIPPYFIYHGVQKVLLDEGDETNLCKPKSQMTLTSLVRLFVSGFFIFNMQ